MKVFRSILFVLCWVGQIAAEYWLGKHVWALNMIPFKMFLAGCLVLSLFWLLEGFLFLYGNRLPKEKKSGRVYRLIAFLLILLTVLACIIGVFAVRKLGNTIQNMTEPKTATTTFSVYVLKDDPAQTIEDAAQYTFGVSTAFDTDNTMEAIDMLDKAVSSKIKTEDYDTVQEMVDALFEKEAGAILLNKAYIPILGETEGYESFSDDTRELYDIDVVMKSQPVAPEDVGDATVDTRPVDNLVPVKDVTKDPFVIYISGSDTRSNMLITSNSDVNILVVVNPVTKNILLLNTPRDYYVPNPAGRGALDKLTHCGVYGISCSATALSDLYDEPVNYYAQINFRGFENLIDAVGGVTVDSDYDFTTAHGKFHITKGPNQLNGKEALGFVRERYAFNSGDRQRGMNQMKVITAVINKLSAGTVITHYNSILDSLQGMFATNFSAKELSDLVKMQLGDKADWNVHSYAVTGGDGREFTYSIPRTRLYVMYQDKNLVSKATNLIDRVIAGDTITDEDVK